jgi:hypothetical protein
MLLRAVLLRATASRLCLNCGTTNKSAGPGVLLRGQGRARQQGLCSCADGPLPLHCDSWFATGAGPEAGARMHVVGLLQGACVVGWMSGAYALCMGHCDRHAAGWHAVGLVESDLWCQRCTGTVHGCAGARSQVEFGLE